jgi:prepilin-type N-terminal cleavage/methylation domain-containing protein
MAAHTTLASTLASPPAVPRPARRPSARGYTVIEVLMAMTVLAIGGAGVITMQKTSVASNAEARKADVANSIARMWIERLRQDAMMWTTPNAANSTTNFGNTTYLNGNVGSNPSQPAWFVPAPMISIGDGTTTMSAGFDILARDQPAGSIANASFCVNIALTWLDTTGLQPGGDMIRADVRVLWPVGIGVVPPSDYCVTATKIDPNLAGATTSIVYHELYLTTNLVENTASQ